MRRFLITTAAVILACAPVLADNAYISMPEGDIAVDFDSDTFTATLVSGTQSVHMESAYLPSEYGRWGNSVLLFMPTGGSACPGMFAWVTLDDKGLRKSEAFGTCSDIVQLQDHQDGVSVEMPRLGSAGSSGFVFDGETVREIELGLASAGVADPTDAAAWEGKPAYEVITSAELEPALLAIMSWETLERVRHATAIHSDDEDMARDGDWFAAVGCMPHNCGGERAGIAISTVDGSVIAAHWTEEAGGTVFGTPPTALPGRLRSLLRGQ